MVLPLLIFLARNEPGRHARWAWGGTAAFTILAILFTYSRGGLVGLAVVIGAILLRSRQRIVAVVVAVLVLVLTLVLAPDRWFDRVRSIASYNQDASVTGRFNSWVFAWRLALDRPVVGGGLEVYQPEIYQRYAPEPDRFHVAHSIYFQTLAEQGFVGLALFLALLLNVLWRAQRLRSRMLLHGAVWFAGAAEALGISTIAFMVSGAFLSMAWNDLFFHFAAVLVLLEVTSAPLLEERPTVDEEAIRPLRRQTEALTCAA